MQFFLPVLPNFRSSEKSPVFFLDFFHPCFIHKDLHRMLSVIKSDKNIRKNWLLLRSCLSAANDLSLEHQILLSFEMDCSRLLEMETSRSIWHVKKAEKHTCIKLFILMIWHTEKSGFWKFLDANKILFGKKQEK